MSRAKLFPWLAISLALALAGCDSCGDLLKGQGGATPLSCKGDPKPN